MGLSGPLGAAVALLGAILLMTLCPAIVIYVFVINRDFDGSVASFWSNLVLKEGFQGVLSKWPAPWGSTEAIEAWVWFLTFGAAQACLQLCVPGKPFYGPVSPRGNVPVYKANGVQCFFITGVLFFMGARFELFDPARLYDIFAELLAVCNVFALMLCVFLTVKGLKFPSSSDSGTNGNLVYDYFWGTELYPRIGKHFDIKTWTNCRMGMMAWTYVVICFAYKQAQIDGRPSNSMLISVVLSALYCFKFFLWETGYWKTMDIAHDRAGYYLCWGCLNWVVCIYTSQPMYLVKHPVQLSQPLAVFITVAGAAMIYINWEADVQRQVFRESDGQVSIWGRKPQYIIAKYTTGAGEERTSLLLASGWWGVARHFHYVPEILASFFWTLPAMFTHLLPWFYTVYLTILLTDRLFRDDTKCKSKYGKHWDAYCAVVPYKILPYIF